MGRRSLGFRLKQAGRAECCDDVIEEDVSDTSHREPPSNLSPVPDSEKFGTTRRPSHPTKPYNNRGRLGKGRPAVKHNLGYAQRRISNALSLERQLARVGDGSCPAASSCDDF